MQNVNHYTYVRARKLWCPSCLWPQGRQSHTLQEAQAPDDGQNVRARKLWCPSSLWPQERQGHTLQGAQLHVDGLYHETC